MFTSSFTFQVELAKYTNAYNEIFDGKKLVIGPHIMDRGNAENYAKVYKWQFIWETQPSIYTFVWRIQLQKLSLFKSSDKRYGSKISGNNIVRNEASCCALYNFCY